MNKLFSILTIVVILFNSPIIHAVTPNSNPVHTASIEKSSLDKREITRPAIGNIGKKGGIEPSNMSSERKALSWLEKAAAQGDAKAQFNLGAMYDAGQIVPQNDAEALKWYQKAATQGDAKAQFNLGVMYSTGRSVAVDNLEAIRWYTKAAEQGHVGAQFNLGVLYDRGDGILQHAGDTLKVAQHGQADITLPTTTEKMSQESEAVKWYQKAAEQGHALAQFNLGVMYSLGRGVPQDDTKAAHWYEKAAQQDDLDAQVNLGSLYAMGQGVSQNDAEAIKWYCRAATKGHTDAQFNLGMMYSVKRGVPQDNARAVATFCQTSVPPVVKTHTDEVKPHKSVATPVRESASESEVSEVPVTNSANQVEAKVHKNLQKLPKSKPVITRSLLQRQREIRDTLF